jgi:hypothetical protein
VTGRTILAKLTGVWIILFMAADAVFRCRGEVRQRQRMGVAFITGNGLVLACQCESKNGMIESLTKAVDPIVTAKTIRAIRNNMSLHECDIDLTMTAYTGILGKRLDIGGMAILTRKTHAVDILSMAL